MDQTWVVVVPLGRLSLINVDGGFLLLSSRRVKGEPEWTDDASNFLFLFKCAA